jgi:hypothetical protein
MTYYKKHRRDCLAYSNRYRLEHSVEKAAYMRKWLKTPKGKTYARRHHLQRFYGITLEQYNEMFEKQGGVCAICGAKPSKVNGTKKKHLHVDHDHKTGKVRGLLCVTCNVKLGFMEKYYEKAKKYLGIKD